HIVMLQRNSGSLHPARDLSTGENKCFLTVKRSDNRPMRRKRPDAKRIVRRRSAPSRERGLATGSLAPTDLRPRSVEEDIGIAVRRLRKGLGLTVVELGAAAGISAGMLSKIENGTISPSLSTIGALAKALNVSIANLFAESDERRDCSFVKSGQGLRIERRGTKAAHL